MLMPSDMRFSLKRVSDKECGSTHLLSQPNSLELETKSALLLLQAGSLPSKASSMHLLTRLS